MKNFSTFLFVLFLTGVCIPDSSFGSNNAVSKNANIAEILNSKKLLKTILKLNRNQYMVTSVVEQQVIIDDGTRKYKVSLDSVLDEFVGCFIDISVDPNARALERLKITENNCPKQAP